MLKTVGFPSTRTGNQTIVGGNLVIGTAGNGVDFSADPHASGMTSELFNDYEEGTWTPAVTSGTGTITSVSTLGLYTKVGRVVTVSGYIKINNNGTGGGWLNVAGLPYVIGNYGGSTAVRSAGFGGHTNVVQASNGVSNFTIWKYDNTYPVGTNAQLNFSFSYFV